MSREHTLSFKCRKLYKKLQDGEGSHVLYSSHSTAATLGVVHFIASRDVELKNDRFITPSQYSATSIRSVPWFRPNLMYVKVCWSHPRHCEHLFSYRVDSSRVQRVFPKRTSASPRTGDMCSEVNTAVRNTHGGTCSMAFLNRNCRFISKKWTLSLIYHPRMIYSTISHCGFADDQKKLCCLLCLNE